MKRIASGLLLAGAVFAFGTPAMAQPSLDLHWGPPTFNCIQIETDGSFNCLSINPNHGNPGSANYQVTVVLGRIGGDGATGVQFGIDYSSTGSTAGIWSTQNTCQGSYQAITIPGPNGNWPNSGSGIAITFGGACVLAAGLDGLIPAYYFVNFGFSPPTGFMDLIPDPNSGFIGMTDCSASTRTIAPSERGSFDFAGAAGVHGCNGAVPTEEASWGEIKSLF